MILRFLLVLAMLDSRRVAWVDRDEPPEARSLRLVDLAAEIVLATEEPLLGLDAKDEYALTLVALGDRETNLRRSVRGKCFRDLGRDGTDYGQACGEWSLHGAPTARAALDVLRRSPGAWQLPSPPWLVFPSVARWSALAHRIGPADKTF